MSLADRFAALREYAYEAIGGKPKVIKGETMFANPLQRLFGAQGKYDIYNPNELLSVRGYRIIDKMLMDDQVKSALHLKKLAITAPGFEISDPEGYDGENEYEPTAFIREVFREMDGTFEQTLKDMLTCLDYGYSITEKVWEIGKPIEALGGKKMIVLSALKTRSPRDIVFTIDDYGNILGVKQMLREIPIDKLIIYTHEGRFGNPYGTPDLHAAYRPWWIKDNAYKWMAMLLERMGIPPIFFLYSNAYTPTDVAALKQVVLSMQAGTGGAIPRPTKPEDLEPWAPELADNVSQVFIPTIEHLNKSISRALLVPGLLGLSDHSSIGALARSQTEFEVFMMVIDGIRQYLGQAIIQEQVIEPLIQLNFPSGTEQPVFTWKPLKDEVKTELYSTWKDMVASGVVTNQDEDEKAIRAKFKMPPLSEAGMARRAEQQQIKDEMSKAALKTAQNPPAPVGGAGKFVGKGAKHDLGEYQIYSTECLFESSRVDYSSVAVALDHIERQGVERVRQAIADSRDDLLDSLRRKAAIDVAFVNQVTLRRWPRVQDAISELMRSAAVLGREDATEETDPLEIETHAAKRVGMTPQQVIQYIAAKVVYVSGVLRDSILKDVKNELLLGVKNGETLGAIIDGVTDVFLPWLGDAKAIDDPNVAQPYRVETIVRTNVTDAYNQGKLNRFRDPNMAPFIIGVQYSAILDERTTPVCQHLHGKIFKPSDPALDALSPPNHYNCRSLLVPIMVDQPIAAKDFITPSEIGEAKELAGKGFLSEELFDNPNHYPAGTPGSRGGEFMPKGGAAAPGSEAEKKKWGKNTHTKIREMIRVGKDASIDGEHVSTVMAEVIKYKQGSLTKAQISALSNYVDSSSGLNGALRSREGDLSKFGPQGRASIEAIDSALRGTKNFALPLTVHRGIPAKVVAGKSVGDTFKDFAYSSTTFSKSVANGFGGATVLEISLPKGFKFISIPSTIEHGNKGSLQRREAEVILPRETVFRIKSIKTAKPTSSGFKGLTTIKVEAIASSIQGEAKTWKKVSAQPGAAVQPGGSVLPAAAMAAGEDLSKFIWKAGDIVWVEGGEDAFEPEDYIDDEEGEDAPE